MTEIVVVGGGIVGSSAAYHLARQRIDVTLVDRADDGGATAAGAGIIAPGTSTKAPPAFHPLAHRSVRYYSELLSLLEEDGETETGYDVVGSLFIATSEDECARLDDLEHGLREWREAGTPGIGDISRLTAQEARNLFPPLAAVKGAIHLTGSARVNGRLLRDSLQRAAQKHGADVVRGNARLLRNGDRISAVEVEGRRLETDAVILAAGAWSAEWRETLGVDIPVYPQRGQILHLDMPGTDTSRWPIVLGFYSHYLLTFPPHRVVAGATREDQSGYDYRVTAGGVWEATGEALRVAPGLAAATLIEVRVGLRPASPDGLPLLGGLPHLQNAQLATGHGASGLQLGPYSGAAVADLALGRRPDLDLAPYAPDRFTSRVAS